jgi:hypothetical protein
VSVRGRPQPGDADPTIAGAGCGGPGPGMEFCAGMLTGCIYGCGIKAV